jgi:DNA primase
MIVDEDLQAVRDRSRIDDVVGAYVTLRRSGGDSLVGLCPFHEEKTPSFRVTPSRGFFYCFGCGEGGDVINFVMKINHLSFVEAVEFLADRLGIQLRFKDGGPRIEPGLRMRVLQANGQAAEFYAAELRGKAGELGRRFLAERGFDESAAEQFGIGYAPRDGRALHNLLNQAGFKDDELVKAGLIRQNGYDFFAGRLLWPIRDAGRSVLGFGARRIHDDDRLPAKYINTPETVVYKKSNVLYGLDLARSHIAKANQAVIVEGYTDVMACHLAGVDTAVASCGTAFGEGHARILQRLIGSADVRQGEVIFTFDGDAAGQNAALKVFELDDTFTSQTYVAIEPTGLDPCDLRIQRGDAALRELVSRRVPLYRFVMRNTIGKYDLERVDSRLAALRAAAPLVTHIRDQSLVTEYIRELAKMLGMNPDEVSAEIRKQARNARFKKQAPPPRWDEEPPEPEDAPPSLPLPLPMPDPKDRKLEAERGTIRLMLKSPQSFTADWNSLTAEDFTHPAYRALAERVLAADPAARESGDWVRQATHADAEAAEQSGVAALAVELAVEPELRAPTPEYANEYAVRLRLLRLSAQIEALKSRLQRKNPVEDPDYSPLFTELVGLEAARKRLQQLI